MMVKLTYNIVLNSNDIHEYYNQCCGSGVGTKIFCRIRNYKFRIRIRQALIFRD